MKVVEDKLRENEEFIHFAFILFFLKELCIYSNEIGVGQ
jgi:hypothetical protein